MNKLLSLLLMSGFLLGACSADEVAVEEVETIDEALVVDVEADEVEASEIETEATEEETEKETEEVTEAVSPSQSSVSFDGYQLINVDGGDTSGYRESNVVVDIGYGDREYWAYTNEYGQLVRVVADEIIIQNDSTEPVNSDGRYYSKMADVPGVGQSSGYDRGHVIADSLGGVANAYNITPQEATLNRHGDQAYMEKVIRDAGGATDFEAIITYPNTETQIPSHYKFTYTILGNRVVDEFANLNPDKLNEELGLTGKSNSSSSSGSSESSKPAETPPASNSSGGDLSSVDANGNGKVTIQEAKDAGFKMPIYSDHWLYPYMDDRDGDGMVGE